MKAFVGFFLTIAFVGPAWADPQDDMSLADKKGFDSYLSSPAYAGRLSDMLKNAKTASFSGCENVTTDAPRIVVIKPIKVGPESTPIAGVWKVTVPAQGCGKSRLINAFFVVGKENKVFFLLTIPGTSRGDPQLQKDTLFYVFMASARKNADCKAPSIINSRFETDEKPSVIANAPPQFKSLVFDRQSRETWSVEACGRFFEVPVHYMHSTAGTTITAAESEVVEVTKDQADKQ